MKILIADDDPQLLRALRITLTVKGYGVVTATNGTQAIAAAVGSFSTIPRPSIATTVFTVPRSIAAARPNNAPAEKNIYSPPDNRFGFIYGREYCR